MYVQQHTSGEVTVGGETPTEARLKRKYGIVFQSPVLYDWRTVKKNVMSPMELVKAMEREGADLIELGIPFSDPTAEGPVIQEANLRALSGGVTTNKIFDMVRELRRTVKIPLVFMTYANVVFSYGAERFIFTCAEYGRDCVKSIADYVKKMKTAVNSKSYR